MVQSSQMCDIKVSKKSNMAAGKQAQTGSTYHYLRTLKYIWSPFRKNVSPRINEEYVKSATNYSAAKKVLLLKT